MDDHWAMRSLGNPEPAVWAPEIPADTDVVWHYTNTEGLIGILSAGPALRATHYRFLNDTEELEYGFCLLEQLWQEYGAQLAPDQDLQGLVDGAIAYARSSTTRRELYVACASLTRDSLAQWRGYAGGAGYSIGFKAHQDMHVQGFSSVALTPAHEVGEARIPDPFDVRIPPAWRRVVYDQGEQEVLLLDVLRYLVGDIGGSGMSCDAAETLAEYLITNLLYVKHPAFQEESEVRAVTAFSPRYRRQFRAGAYGVTPFVTLMGRDKDNLNPGTSVHEQISENRLDVAEVMVGPCSDREAAALGAALLLETQGMVDAVVSRSSAPYRQ